MLPVIPFANPRFVKWQIYIRQRNNNRWIETITLQSKRNG
jgi:hypothetical protein